MNDRETSIQRENDSLTCPVQKAGLYIHIPFCVRKCIYCDFNSVPDSSYPLQSGYFDALKKEIRLFQKSAEEAESAVPAQPFADTLFIGGGTPSSVDLSLIEDLLKELYAGWDPVNKKNLPDGSDRCGRKTEGDFVLLGKDAEITMELNPGTADYESLLRYRKAGINRLSMGVQSFHNEELKFLGRIHTAEEAEACFRDARRAGFDNINIDLIFGIPGSTAESWKKTLQRALDLKPDHISFYSLQIEEGTPLYRMFRSDQIDQVSDEENRRMYHDAVDLLKRYGYIHYEISNAALPGKECRHNLKYWSMCDYVGFGVSAHSYLNAETAERLKLYTGAESADAEESADEDISVCCGSADDAAGGVRFYNEDDISAYMRRMESESRGYIPPEVQKNSLRDEISESLFTSLRKVEGISVRWFDERFRKEGITFMDEFGEKIGKFLKEGYLILEKNETGEPERLRFTLKGFDISNYILAELI